MYFFDETTLHNKVTRKKNAAERRINGLELKVSIFNVLMAVFLLAMAVVRHHPWAFLYAALFTATSIFVQYFRQKRKKEEQAFDRSLLGELNHAIALVSALIKFNYFMAIGYLVPLLAIGIWRTIDRGDSLEEGLLMSGLFILGFIVMRWEQKACNIPRRKSLVALREKLMEE